MVAPNKEITDQDIQDMDKITGLSDEDVSEMDKITGLSTDQPEQTSEVTEQPQPKKKGIDITPSNLLRQTIGGAEALLTTPVDKGLNRLLNGAYQKQAEEIKQADNLEQWMRQNKIPNTPSNIEKYNRVLNGQYPLPDTFKENKDANIQNMIKSMPLNMLAGKDVTTPVGDFIGDMMVYGALPASKLGQGAGALGKIGDFVLNASINGGIPYAIEDMKNGNNPIEGLGKGTGIAMLLNGIAPVGKAAYNYVPLVKPVTDFVSRVGSGALKGLTESFAMGPENIQRMIESPRGTEISKKANYYGTDDFIQDIANRFKSGTDVLRQQEREAFAKSRDKLLADNKDTSIDLSDYIKNAYDKLVDAGFIGEKGITPTGQRAEGLKQLLSDLNYYNGKFDVNEVQRLKSNVLDDIINYKAPIGQNINNSTSTLQNVARGMRKDINTLLQDTLGPEYTQANKKISEVLQQLDNVPEIKDLTNAENIDTLASKLKRVGTTRQTARNELNKLENIMNKNNIQVSDTTLADDLLDYATARDINSRIRTGQDAGFRNVFRRSLFQPTTEFYVDRVVPAVKAIKNAKPLEKIITPLVSKSIPMLIGGVEFNENEDRK